MALLDRVRDAVGFDNRIEAAQPRAPDPQRADPADPAAAPGTRKPAEERASFAAEPKAITRTYYVEQRGNARTFYHDYQRKSLAMRADAASISSRREDLTTIRAMLTLAEARGWSDIKIAGSAAFRREAWIEAQARGLSAQGHKASDLDRQEADRRRAERGPGQGRPAQVAAPNRVEPAAPSAPPAQAARSTQVPQASIVPSASVVRQLGGSASAATNRNQAGRERANRTRNAAAAAGSAPGREQTKGSKPDTGVGGNRRVRSPVGAMATPESAKPSAPEHRRAIQDAVGQLSPDGQLILAALAEKIDRQMSKLSADAKLETKAFAASELLKKERREGPVVLSPELRIVATSPASAPVRQIEPALPAAAPLHRAEPEPARRSRSR